MRNVAKQAEQGRNIVRKNDRLDLYGQELHALLDKSIATKDTNDIFDAVVNAYYMGLAVGTRNGKRKAAQFG